MIFLSYSQWNIFRWLMLWDHYISDIMISKKGCEGDGKLWFFGREESPLHKKAQNKFKINQWRLLKIGKPKCKSCWKGVGDGGLAEWPFQYCIHPRVNRFVSDIFGCQAMIELGFYYKSFITFCSMLRQLLPKPE